MRSKQTVPKRTRGVGKKKKRKIKKKPRSGVRKYNLEDLIKAAKEVQDGCLTTREAVVKYDLPYSTLHDRVTGRTDMDVTTRGPRFVLGKEGEKMLCEYFHFLLTLGIRTTSSEMKSLASELAKLLGVLNSKRNLSVKWYATFVKRWPESVVEPKSVDTKSVNTYFTQLREMLDRYQLIDKPRRLYILDETEICIPYRPGSSAPFPDKLSDSTMKSDDGSGTQDGEAPGQEKKRTVSKNVTLYGCGNAMGRALKPFFACLSNLRKTEEVLVNCQGHRGLMLGKWKNSEEIFQYYLENHFKGQTVAQDDGRPVLLLFDAHKAKPSSATVRWARENHIILFPLPPHVHQLPDVGCMEHFKDSFEEECISFLEDFIVDDLVNRNHACNIAGRIYTEVVSPENLIACFRKIGVYPFNPRVVDPNATLFYSRKDVAEPSHNDIDSDLSRIDAASGRIGKKKAKVRKLLKKHPAQSSQEVIADFLRKKNPYLLTDQAIREMRLKFLMEEESPDVVMKKAIRDVKKSGLSMRGAAKRHGIPYKKLFEEMAKSNSSIRDKQGYRSYSMANLQKAMRVVKEKKMTCHTASKKFGVPYSTLHDRVVERVNPDVCSPGPQPLIGPKEEEKIADFLQYMSLLGYRFQQKEVQSFVTTYAHKKKILEPGRALSEAWYRHFMKRHKRAFPEMDTNQKPVAGTKFVNWYFSDLHDIMSRHKLLEKPELVFNVDEVEIDLPYKVVYKLLTIKNAHLRRVTIIACGNAQGESLPPYFIYRGQHKFNQCHLKHAPAGSQGRSTLSRHTSPEVLQQYLYEHLIPSVNEDEESPALVLFDAYKMKVTEQQIAWARDNRVILFPLPPGLRAESKNNEVGILQNFRQCFEKTFKAYTSCHPGSTVNKYNICGLAGGVYEDAIAPACLASHFRRMGIVPFNPKAVDLEADFPDKTRRGSPATKEETDEADEFLNSQNPFLLLKQDLGRQTFSKNNKRKADNDIVMKAKKPRLDRTAGYNSSDDEDDDDDDSDELSDDDVEHVEEHVEEDGAFADVPIAGLTYQSPFQTIGDWSGYATVQASVEEKRSRLAAAAAAAAAKMAGTTSHTSAVYHKMNRMTTLQEFQQPAATEQAVQTITEQSAPANNGSTTMHNLDPVLLSNIKVEASSNYDDIQVTGAAPAPNLGPISLQNIKTEEIQECSGNIEIQFPGGEGQVMTLDMATNIAQSVVANCESEGKTTQIIYLHGEADLSDEAVQQSLVQQAIGDNLGDNQEVIIVYVPEYMNEVTV